MSRVKHQPDAEAVLYIRVPGWLKNQIMEQADLEGTSINTWCANELRLAIRNSLGLPPPPPAAAPLPTPSDALHAYLTDTPLTTPCGRTRTCTGLTEPPETLNGLSWCIECGIRLT